MRLASSVASQGLGRLALLKGHEVRAARGGCNRWGSEGGRGGGTCGRGSLAARCRYHKYKSTKQFLRIAYLESHLMPPGRYLVIPFFDQIN